MTASVVASFSSLQFLSHIFKYLLFMPLVLLLECFCFPSSPGFQRYQPQGSVTCSYKYLWRNSPDLSWQPSRGILDFVSKGFCFLNQRFSCQVRRKICKISWTAEAWKSFESGVLKLNYNQQNLDWRKTVISFATTFGCAFGHFSLPFG